MTTLERFEKDVKHHFVHDPARGGDNGALAIGPAAVSGPRFL
jgi:hypothetical protein